METERKWQLYAHLAGRDYPFMKLGPTIDSFGMLFRLYNHVPKPMEVLMNKKYCLVPLYQGDKRLIEGYSVFQSDVLPCWEDKENQGGGTLNCRTMFERKEDMEKAWLSMWLSLCNEDLPFVTGVRMLSKRCQRTLRVLSSKAEIWFSKSASEEIVSAIQKACQERLSLTFVWTPHKM